MSFEMTALNAETAKVVIDASSLDIEMIPEELGDVTVILTKQENKTK
jgi:flagellar hook-length control protein FliK